MNAQKKLTRGLPDISPLFSDDQKILSKNGTDPRARGVPSLCMAGDGGSPKLICTSLIPFTAQFRVPDLVALIERLLPTFERIFYVTMVPIRSRYEALARVMSLPAWEEVSYRSDVYLQTIDENFAFGCVPARALREIVHPHLACGAVRDLEPPKKSLLLIDQFSTEFSQLDRNHLHVLDHYVLVIEADVNRLTEAYEWLRMSVPEHPGSLYSLLLIGRGAEALWEFIYERFHEMVLRFLGREVGFFGWIENGVVHVYADFLLAEAQWKVQNATKKKLFDALLRGWKTNGHLRSREATT